MAKVTVREGAAHARCALLPLFLSNPSGGAGFLGARVPGVALAADGGSLTPGLKPVVPLPGHRSPGKAVLMRRKGRAETRPCTASDIPGIEPA